MHRTALPLCWFLFLSMLTARHVAAHCEVPCGIYDDQARFQQMLEDTKTIAKASDQIHLLATESSPQNMNQLVRWVTTNCLLYTSPSPRDGLLSRMPSSA